MLFYMQQTSFSETEIRNLGATFHLYTHVNYEEMYGKKMESHRELISDNEYVLGLYLVKMVQH